MLLASGARRVVDLGCGRGELLQWLRDHEQFTRLIGIDIDVRVLAQARATLGLDLLRPDGRLHVCYGSFEQPDWDIPAVDAAVMLETIEHIDPGRLPPRRTDCIRPQWCPAVIRCIGFPAGCFPLTLAVVE